MLAHFGYPFNSEMQSPHKLTVAQLWQKTEQQMTAFDVCWLTHI